jgi:hypothetical protein
VGYFDKNNPFVKKSTEWSSGQTILLD